MPEPFILAKATDMSLGTLGKATSLVVKGLFVLALISGAVWACYVTFVKPHINPTPTTTQMATQIDNYYIYPKQEKKFFFGVRMFGLNLGVSKEAEYKLEPIIKTNVIK